MGAEDAAKLKRTGIIAGAVLLGVVALAAMAWAFAAWALPDIYAKANAREVSVVVCSDGWPLSQTFVINLDNNAERRARMHRQLAYLRAPYVRISAVYGRAVQAALQTRGEDAAIALLGDARLAFRPALHVRGWGEAGCALSHLTALLRAADRVHAGEALDGPILVLEDDVEMDTALAGVLRENIAWLSRAHPEWSMFAVGFCGSDPHISRHGADVTPRVLALGCTHAYILRNVAAATRMFDHINKARLVDPLDYLWMSLTAQEDFLTYAYAPNNVVVQNRSLQSDISADQATEWENVLHPIPK